MTFENDEKAAALLMMVGAFPGRVPQNEEEAYILNDLEEACLVYRPENQGSNGGHFHLEETNEFRETYSNLVERGVNAIQKARSAAADYPVKDTTYPPAPQK